MVEFLTPAQKTTARRPTFSVFKQERYAVKFDRADTQLKLYKTLKFIQSEDATFGVGDF